MAKYVIDETTLSAISSGIRSLRNLDGKLSTDDMQTQLATVQTSIDSALMEITGKGVVVPSNANSDNLASLISSIVMGESNAYMCTRIIATATNELVFDDLPFLPNIHMYLCLNNVANTYTLGVAVASNELGYGSSGAYMSGKLSTNKVYFDPLHNNANVSSGYAGKAEIVDERNTYTMYAYRNGSATYKFSAGYTYLFAFLRYEE